MLLYCLQVNNHVHLLFQQVPSCADKELIFTSGTEKGYWRTETGQNQHPENNHWKYLVDKERLPSTQIPTSHISFLVF